MGYSSKNALDGKSTRQLARRPILRGLTYKTKILQLLEFLENYKDLYGKNRWTARHASQQLFSAFPAAIKSWSYGQSPQNWPSG